MKSSREQQQCCGKGTSCGVVYVKNQLEAVRAYLVFNSGKLPLYPGDMTLVLQEVIERNG